MLYHKGELRNQNELEPGTQEMQKFHQQGIYTWTRL